MSYRGRRRADGRRQAARRRLSLRVHAARAAALSGLHRVVDPEDHGWREAQAVIEMACPLLSDAAGSEVDGLVGSHDPVAAVEDALNMHGFDEAIVSTLPAHLSRWLHLDLPSKVEGMGVPVTRVTGTGTGAERRRAFAGVVQGLSLM